MITIPLKNGAENARQEFSATLGENLLDFSLKYLSYVGEPMWVLDVRNDGSPITLGKGLQPNGVINLGMFGKLVFVGESATLDNLGVANQLIWAVE